MTAPKVAKLTTKDIRKLALKHGPAAIRCLRELAASHDQRIAAKAENALRRYGFSLEPPATQDQDDEKAEH